jgi:pilus assembly protein Flp/PilA
MSSLSPYGQGLVEYAVIILLIAIAVIVLVTLFGQGVGNMFSNIIANF